LRGGLSLAAMAASPAALAAPSFEQWRASFRQHALSQRITEATWIRCMAHVEPDLSVFNEIGNQPEFKE